MRYIIPYCMILFLIIIQLACSTDNDTVYLYPLMKGQKIGYIDRTGKFVIPPQFDEGNHFSEGLALVKKGNQWSFIEKSGKQVIVIEAAEVGDFSEGLARIRRGNVWGFINKKGEIAIKPRWPLVQGGQGGRC